MHQHQHFRPLTTNCLPLALTEIERLLTAEEKELEKDMSNAAKMLSDMEKRYEPKSFLGFRLPLSS